jgi:predicted peptidase
MSNSLVLIFILNLSVVCLAMPQQKLSMSIKSYFSKLNRWIHIYILLIERYSIDKSKITVSGVSSGAAMASQMHIAYSSIISGSGTVAGR